MKSDSNEKLDRLLVQWADANCAETKSVESLQQRIVQRVSDLGQQERRGDPLVPVEASRSSSKWPIVAACLAVAASLFLAFGLLRQFSAVDDIVLAESPVHRSFSRDEQARIVSAYQEVFGSTLSWVLGRNGQADIGLVEPDSEEIDESKRFVAIRLVVWSRKANGGPWREVQAFDVLAEQEKLIQIPGTNAGTAPMSIWAYPIDEKLIAIDLSFQPYALTDRSVEGSFLQPWGESSNIFDYEQDGVEYRLYQTAEMLDDLG